MCKQVQDPRKEEIVAINWDLLEELCSKPGRVWGVDKPELVNVTLDRYIVTEVYKIGEKAEQKKRGPKPQGYNVYRNGVFEKFLPYGKQPSFLVKTEVKE